jgi:hypothetical protein
MVYFDQYYVVFFMQLAALSTLSHICIVPQKSHAMQTLAAIRNHRIVRNRPAAPNPTK